MVRTGTNQLQLKAMIEARGFYVSQGHLSNVLSGSRPCSRWLALHLHELTGVDLKTLIQWPHVRPDQTTLEPAQVSD